MESKPLVSIIVPIYNVENYLNRCINSLITQNYKPFEIILVDDCSTDQSAKIAKEYANSYPNMCVFIQREKNGGLSAARNTGMKYAKGEWLSFVDSDDWVSDDYLNELINVAQKSKADVVLGNANYAYDSGEMTSAGAFGNLKSGAEKKAIIALCRSYACGRLFRRSLFEEARIEFPEDIRRSEDIGTIIPILTKSKKISLLEKPIYYYYQRSNSLSNTNKNLDLSFYPKTLQRMFELSDKGYEEELEFRAIHEMLYGMVYLMMCSDKSKRDFISHIQWFNGKFPTWKNNKYLSDLPLAKRMFIKLAGNKNYLICKILVKARNK